jgi:hypothetical protein
VTKATRLESKCPEGKFIPRPGVHSLSNVNPDAQIADCSVCGPQVPIRVRYRGTLTPRCECRLRQRERDAERRSGGYRWPESHASRRARKIRKKYNMSIADYDRMFAEQAGKCGICREECEQQLGVDHDHTSGAVRGLLCNRCNMAIGLMFDQAEIAERAAVYLRAHGSPAA